MSIIHNEFEGIRDKYEDLKQEVYSFINEEECNKIPIYCNIHYTSRIDMLNQLKGEISEISPENTMHEYEQMQEELNMLSDLLHRKLSDL